MTEVRDALTEQVNQVMIGFDLILGTATLLAPDLTLRVLGHAPPSPDARQLFRRCGPIWLTFAAAHATAARRGRPEDWWALAWLRATELGTDALWAQSPAIQRREAKLVLRLAGAGNLLLTGAFAARARSARA